MALVLETQTKLKKVQEKRRKEEEEREKRRNEIKNHQDQLFDSEEDEDLLKAALAIEEGGIAARNHHQQDDHPHSGGHVQDGQEEGGSSAKPTEGGGLHHGLDMLQKLSLNVRSARRPQEMKPEQDLGAGPQGGQGAGNAHHPQEHRAHLQEEEVDQVVQHEHQELPTPQLSPQPTARTPSPTGQHTPARVMLTPVWERKRRQRLSSSLPGSRRRNLANKAKARDLKPEMPTASPSRMPGTNPTQEQASPGPFPPNNKCKLHH